jgi:hypothetical protein
MALAVPVVKLRAITHLARRARPPAPHAALPALLDRGADHPVDPPRCPACVPVDALSVGDGGPVVRAWRGAAAVPVGVAAGDGAGRRDVGALPSPTHRHPLMRPPVLRPRHARVRSCSSSPLPGIGARGGVPANEGVAFTDPSLTHRHPARSVTEPCGTCYGGRSCCLRSVQPATPATNKTTKSSTRRTMPADHRRTWGRRQQARPSRRRKSSPKAAPAGTSSARVPGTGTDSHFLAAAHPNLPGR